MLTDRHHTDPWRATASRVSHPSQVGVADLEPGELLGQIAAGLGAVLVPTFEPGDRTGVTRELLLSSPAYDVWVMHWPTGATADTHSHGLPVAFHVAEGTLTETRFGNLPVEHGTGATVVVPANTPHAMACVRAATTVHVHARHLA